MKRPGEIGISILKYLVLVGAVYISLENPKFVKRLIKELKRQIQIYNFKKTIQRLKNRKLISLKETRTGYYVKITQWGKDYIQKYNLDDLEIKKPLKWDNKWRMVIFDIPDFKKKERDFFALKLKNIGFYRLQESVFVCPYECEKEIDFLKEVCEISPYVQYGVLNSISNSHILKEHFNP